MNDEPLMNVVVQTILFLELSDDNIVDEDSACRMLEGIAASLQELDRPTKERFLQYLQQRATRALLDSERELLENLPSGFGLVPD